MLRNGQTRAHARQVRHESCIKLRAGAHFVTCDEKRLPFVSLVSFVAILRVQEIHNLCVVVQSCFKLASLRVTNTRRDIRLPTTLTYVNTKHRSKYSQQLSTFRLTFEPWKTWCLCPWLFAPARSFLLRPSPMLLWPTQQQLHHRHTQTVGVEGWRGWSHARRSHELPSR